MCFLLWFPWFCPCSGLSVSQVNLDFYSSATLLDGGFSASHSSQHIGQHSSSVSGSKEAFHGCLSRLGAQYSAITVFNPLAAKRDMCCREKGSLPKYNGQ